MGPILFRVGLLAVGLGLTEIGISALVSGSPAFWLLLPMGILGLVGGSAGFVGPLWGPTRRGGGHG